MEAKTEGADDPSLFVQQQQVGIIIIMRLSSPPGKGRKDTNRQRLLQYGKPELLGRKKIKPLGLQ
jgi:hypothetical protein